VVANLVVSVILTPVFDAIRIPRRTDATATDDYDDRIVGRSIEPEPTLIAS
jgi:hypothetical protein